MTIHVHDGDLPAGLDLGREVAVDSETMGLATARDRLCLVQLSAGDGDAHLVRFIRPAAGVPPDYEAPRLRALLADPAVEKVFHFARFDVAVLYHYLGVLARPVYCTKIASKLARTYTDRHGLKDLCRELLGRELAKEQQSSDWGGDILTEAQTRYAAADVLHLHELRVILDTMLVREGRDRLARACFEFLPTRAELDEAGWAGIDVFAHS